ncbi:MAG TPA: hypothetical protein PLC98_25065 [Anaerolineales bacterium]|nr:hypothetical protein [Anaerolineales bacterium]
MVLSHIQARALLAARAAGATSSEATPDLGLTRTQVGLDEVGVAWGGAFTSWETLERIVRDENGVFVVEDGGVRKVQAYSDLTDRAVSLYPTAGAPTMLVAGFPMHRIKDTDPWRDTQAKIKASAPTGRVLDTCTGLGYTAILAAEMAEHVTTVELDPACQEVARANPWSARLFDHPRITQLIGDIGELIATLPEAGFNRIIHDPPTFSLAGELYSGEFYRACWRVLRPGGRLFHYIGDPESRSGAQVTRGVVRRLQEAGFARVQPAPAAFGVTASR